MEDTHDTHAHSRLHIWGLSQPSQAVATWAALGHNGQEEAFSMVGSVACRGITPWGGQEAMCFPCRESRPGGTSWSPWNLLEDPQGEIRSSLWLGGGLVSLWGVESQQSHQWRS